MVLGPKEIAVLAMLQQGLDMLGDHMSSRINRRLDDAQNRVGGLETKFTSLRSAIRHSLAQVTAPEHRPIRQQQQHAGTTRGRVPFGAASTNQMPPNQPSTACKDEQNLRDSLPALSSSHLASLPDSSSEGNPYVPSAREAPGHDAQAAVPSASARLWGGAVMEFVCQDSESEKQLASVAVSVFCAAPPPSCRSATDMIDRVHGTFGPRAEHCAMIAGGDRALA